MEKTFLSKILDNLFLIFAVFVLAFLWIRYYEHNSFLILLYSTLITFSVCGVIYFINKKKQSKKAISLKESKTIATLCNTFLFSSQAETLKIFEQALIKRNIEYEKTHNFLSFEQCVIMPAFNKIEIDDNALLEIIMKVKSKKTDTKTLCICAKSFSDNAKKLSTSFSEFSVVLYDIKQTYIIFFKPINYEVRNEKVAKTKTPFKQKIRELLGVVFNKNRFKSYFLSAIVLFIASYFMRYNLYYLTFSSLLILCAFFSYFNKPFNKPEKNLFGE